MIARNESVISSLEAFKHNQVVYVDVQPMNPFSVLATFEIEDELSTEELMVIIKTTFGAPYVVTMDAIKNIQRSLGIAQPSASNVTAFQTIRQQLQVRIILDANVEYVKRRIEGLNWLGLTQVHVSRNGNNILVSFETDTEILAQRVVSFIRELSYVADVSLIS